MKSENNINRWESCLHCDYLIEIPARAKITPSEARCRLWKSTIMEYDEPCSQFKPKRRKSNAL